MVSDVDRSFRPRSKISARALPRCAAPPHSLHRACSFVRSVAHQYLFDFATALHRFTAWFLALIYTSNSPSFSSCRVFPHRLVYALSFSFSFALLGFHIEVDFRYLQIRTLLLVVLHFRYILRCGTAHAFQPRRWTFEYIKFLYH